jgi:hypothetical protein
MFQDESDSSIETCDGPNITALGYVFASDQIINSQLAGRVLQMSLGSINAAIDVQICTGDFNSTLDFIAEYQPHAVFLDVGYMVCSGASLDSIYQRLIQVGRIPLQLQLVLMGSKEDMQQAKIKEMTAAHDNIHTLGKPFNVGDFKKITGLILQSIQKVEIRSHRLNDSDAWVDVYAERKIDSVMLQSQYFPSSVETCNQHLVVEPSTTKLCMTMSQHPAQVLSEINQIQIPYASLPLWQQHPQQQYFRCPKPAI